MADDNPSIISHVSIGTNDYARAVDFYDRVLATLGCKRIVEHPCAVAYGKMFPEFWVQTPIDGQSASIGNGTHFGFVAPTKQAVHDFYDAALSAGATADGPPGPRPDYGEPYYGCFVRDPDGHKIEAAFWDMELIQKLYRTNDGMRATGAASSTLLTAFLSTSGARYRSAGCRAAGESGH